MNIFLFNRTPNSTLVKSSKLVVTSIFSVSNTFLKALFFMDVKTNDCLVKV